MSIPLNKGDLGAAIWSDKTYVFDFLNIYIQQRSVVEIL